MHVAMNKILWDHKIVKLKKPNLNIPEPQPNLKTPQTMIMSTNHHPHHPVAAEGNTTQNTSPALPMMRELYLTILSVWGKVII